MVLESFLHSIFKRFMVSMLYDAKFHGAPTISLFGETFAYLPCLEAKLIHQKMQET